MYHDISMFKIMNIIQRKREKTMKMEGGDGGWRLKSKETERLMMSHLSSLHQEIIKINIESLFTNIEHNK